MSDCLSVVLQVLFFITVYLYINIYLKSPNLSFHSDFSLSICLPKYMSAAFLSFSPSFILFVPTTLLQLPHANSLPYENTRNKQIPSPYENTHNKQWSLWGTLEIPLVYQPWFFSPHEYNCPLPHFSTPAITKLDHLPESPDVDSETKKNNSIPVSNHAV